MGYGLGKNSPITLTQSRENFEALIGRHGQLVRWRKSRKCPCVNAATGQPDLHCEKCGGTGEIYGRQTECDEIANAAARDEVCDIGEEYEQATVNEVYDAYGIEREFLQYGRYVKVANAQENEIFEIHLTKSLVETAEDVALTHICDNYYVVSTLVAKKANIDGARDSVPCDILSATDIFDDSGVEYVASDFRQNQMQLARKDGEAILQNAVITAGSVEYAQPFCFAVLEQTADKGDADFLHGVSGDAVCTFAYKYDVAEGDVITVMSGTQTKKAVIQKRDGDDAIPDDFVKEIESIETASKSYNKNDYMLVGDNRIRWLCEDAPAEAAMISVVWRSCPTYRVAANMPQTRTSENQRQPRKVALKLMTAFQTTREIRNNGG